MFVIVNSITINIIGKKLSRNQNVNAFSFSGATIDDMVDFAKPVIKRKPKKIILHVGTKNLKMDQPKKIKNKVAGLVDSIKAEHPSIDVAVSSIIFRSDDQSLNSKIRLFTVPYFSVRSSRLIINGGHLDFQMYLGGGRRIL